MIGPAHALAPLAGRVANRWPPNSPFFLNISGATHYNQCGDNGNEFCEFSDFTVLDGGKNCDLVFNPYVLKFDGTDNAIVNMGDYTIDVGLEMYTKLTSGVKLTYSYSNDTSRYPIVGLTEGGVYYVYKREGQNKILLMATAAQALAAYANTTVKSRTQYRSTCLSTAFTALAMQVPRTISATTCRSRSGTKLLSRLLC